MAKPSTVFHWVGISDGDMPATNLFFWTLRDALEQTARCSSWPSITIHEQCPKRGRRLVLHYAPYSGLLESGEYVTPDKRWRSGYPADFLNKILEQWPSKEIRPPWRNN